MTQESYNALLPYKDLMRTIIINSAASSLPIGFQQALQQAGKEDGYKLSCTCSSGWFKLTSAVYQKFLKFRATHDDKKEESTDRKSDRKNKRK